MTAAPIAGGRWTVALLGIILPALVYAAIITHGSFNLFAPAYGWQAYNHYALAIAAGHQDVAADVISGEGLYVGGKVYMYYGLLPALLRLLFIPFIDLRVVPVSNLMVLAMVVIGQGFLQVSLFRIFRTRHGDSASLVLTIAASLALWFASGGFLIVQNGNIYHEPYAAAVMTSGVFIALLAHDLLLAKRLPSGGRLLVYAALAGATVFTRQTYAVGLYAATVVLLVAGSRGPDQRVPARLRRAVAPLAVLFVFGASYLAVNWLRFGHVGVGWSTESYGYALLGIEPEKIATIARQQFNVVRIVPTMIYVLAGGADLRESLIARWGGGTVATYNEPVRYLLFAPVLLAFAAAGVAVLINDLRQAAALAWLRVGITLGLSLIALLELSYATMNWRYTAELSPLLIWLALVALADPALLLLARRHLRPVAGMLAIMTTVSIVYCTRLAYQFPFDHPKDRASLVAPLPPELAALATAPRARDPAVRSGPGAYSN